MRFEWDLTKADVNAKKHGVSFEVAASCFGDPQMLLLHDIAHSGREDRYIAIAKAQDARILTLVFTLRRSADGEKIYRLINARIANYAERRAYLE